MTIGCCNPAEGITQFDLWNNQSQIFYHDSTQFHPNTWPSLSGPYIDWNKCY